MMTSSSVENEQKFCVCDKHRMLRSTVWFRWGTAVYHGIFARHRLTIINFHFLNLFAQNDYHSRTSIDLTRSSTQARALHFAARQFIVFYYYFVRCTICLELKRDCTVKRHYECKQKWRIQLRACVCVCVCLEHFCSVPNEQKENKTSSSRGRTTSHRLEWKLSTDCAMKTKINSIYRVV